MLWLDRFKEAGVSIHVIATGGGAGLQQELWAKPGSSAYLSGASFPYSPEEQIELLGFLPSHYCSAEAAVDLASAAYMKAYKFGGKKPIGLGITASVASEKVHRGEHQIFACVISDDKVRLHHQVLTKGIGPKKRMDDGFMCDDIGSCALLEVLPDPLDYHNLKFTDATELARSQFFLRPFFAVDGQRFNIFPFTNNKFALMSGAFNPPHQGHLEIASQVEEDYFRKVVFEITANPPHKAALSVQELLKRAKLLQGHPRLFTQSLPMYLDKARAFPGVGLVMGADAALRLLDPKWGHDPIETFQEFDKLGTRLYVAGRNVDGKFVSLEDIWASTPLPMADLFSKITRPIEGQWDISSTQLRNHVSKEHE
jgi:hypothetical protein